MLQQKEDEVKALKQQVSVGTVRARDTCRALITKLFAAYAARQITALRREHTRKYGI